MILNIIFVTMMFGTGLPILFPIAMVSLFVIYVQEKGLLYYGYREPPHYDDVLNLSVLNTLISAPLLILAFGYWMLSNKQLISNENLEPKDRKSVPYDSTHYMINALNPAEAIGRGGPAAPLLILFWVYLIYVISTRYVSDEFFDRIFGRIWGCKACCRGGRDIEADSEDLDIYFKHLDDDDRNWSIQEELNNREMLGMQCMLDSTMDMMKNHRIGKRQLQGIHTYDILRNPTYVQYFQYVSPSIPNREQFIKDGDNDDTNSGFQSDLVRIVLNLAFIGKETLDSMDLTSEGIDEHYRRAKLDKEANTKPSGLSKAFTVYEANEKPGFRSSSKVGGLGSQKSILKSNFKDDVDFDDNMSGGGDFAINGDGDGDDGKKKKKKKDKEKKEKKKDKDKKVLFTAEEDPQAQTMVKKDKDEKKKKKKDK